MKNMLRLSFLMLFLVSVSLVMAQRQQVKCGKWRTDVKTLTDAGGVALLTQTPTIATLDELGAVIPPKILHANNAADGKVERYPTESKVIEMTVMITAIKLNNDDGDLHFSMKSVDSDKTMVGEIPNPACNVFEKFPDLRQQFTSSRIQGKVVWDMLKKSKKPVKVKITGIPFWDGYDENRPKGVSEYFREIHPILKIEVL
ncbi:MAG: hypothetical protein HXX13_04470 [Bacteroidetes bacterium]|nr:hypothetical protein [Bacteroidota bacterium]